MHPPDSLLVPGGTSQFWPGSSAPAPASPAPAPAAHRPRRSNRFWRRDCPLRKARQTQWLRLAGEDGVCGGDNTEKSHMSSLAKFINHKMRNAVYYFGQKGLIIAIVPLHSFGVSFSV